MKRRVRNVVRDALNDVVHGRYESAVKRIPETGTTVVVERMGADDYLLRLRLCGDDVVEPG